MVICTKANTYVYIVGYTRDPDELFFRDDIQTLLRRITGCNYDKIFQPRRLGTSLQSPKYDLLTQEEIDKLMAEVKQKTETKLQMPPLLKEWKPIDDVLSVNPELQGFDTAKYVFTDISFGISNRVGRNKQFFFNEKMP
jgi:small subunit ribosomal protein S22